MLSLRWLSAGNLGAGRVTLARDRGDADRNSCWATTTLLGTTEFGLKLPNLLPVQLLQRRQRGHLRRIQRVALGRAG